MADTKKSPMIGFTVQDHRRRLENIRDVERKMTSCVQRNMITDYIPGHYVYQSNSPTEEEDKAKFKMLSDAGIGIVQTWEFWYSKESQHKGKNMYVPADADKTRKFINNIHDAGLKILPYTSSNFMERYNEYFNSDWAYNYVYDLGFGSPKGARHLAHCSATSPGWREQLLKQYINLLDNFEYDGVYIDTGYLRRNDFLTCHRYYFDEAPVVKDDVLAFREEPKYDGGMEDLLGMIYHEVHRRGGLLKLHKEGADTIYSDMKVYDYLWVGEAVPSQDFVRKSCQGFRPYVVPDFNYKPEKELFRYMYTIPYMQFPILRDGTIGIGSPDAAVLDLEYGLKWLKLYKEMTTESTWCYVDAKVPSLIDSVGGEVVTSYFANYDLYAAVANYSDEEATITLKDNFVEVDPINGEAKISNTFKLSGKDMKILKRVYDPSKSIMPEDVPMLYLLSQEEDMEK